MMMKEKKIDSDENDGYGCEFLDGVKIWKKL